MTEVTNELIFEVLKKVQAAQAEMRSKMEDMETKAIARDEKTQAQIGFLAQGQTGMRGDIKRMSDHIYEITMSIDHHTTRLDAIERHLGLAASKH